MNYHLYRHYSDDNKLLYVGKTSVSAFYRMGQHSHSARWYNKIAKMTIQNFNSEAELSAAEIDAIKFERPIYNIVHNKKRRYFRRNINSNNNDSSCFISSSEEYLKKDAVILRHYLKSMYDFNDDIVFLKNLQTELSSNLEHQFIFSRIIERITKRINQKKGMIEIYHREMSI